MDMRDRLPEHAVPEQVRGRRGAGMLRIEGRVRHSLRLRPNDLAALRRRRLEAPFACEEGWTVPGLRWEGVALGEVLARAQPLDDAEFASIGSGDYTLCLPLDQARRALLCDTLDGQPLSVAHGGPWRLVVPGGQCFSSVKWVERIELSAEAQPSTAERIARGRLGER